MIQQHTDHVLSSSGDPRTYEYIWRVKNPFQYDEQCRPLLYCHIVCVVIQLIFILNLHIYQTPTVEFYYHLRATFTNLAGVKLELVGALSPVNHKELYQGWHALK